PTRVELAGELPADLPESAGDENDLVGDVKDVCHSYSFQDTVFWASNARLNSRPRPGVPRGTKYPPVCSCGSMTPSSVSVPPSVISAPSAFGTAHSTVALSSITKCGIIGALNARPSAAMSMYGVMPPTRPRSAWMKSHASALRYSLNCWSVYRFSPRPIGVAVWRLSRAWEMTSSTRKGSSTQYRSRSANRLSACWARAYVHPWFASIMSG